MFGGGIKGQRKSSGHVTMCFSTQTAAVVGDPQFGWISLQPPGLISSKAPLGDAMQEDVCEAPPPWGRRSLC